ncbi:MAG: hypothetical protein A2X18_07750 [Bacteroidetes bacterium GWF2_40_14]|nr:MAG: hypothetical protein A2X18_07750 [Bacteroidetes bacterium GWF2_40_14]
MEIYRPDDTLLLDVSVKDGSYSYNAIMDSHELVLMFALTQKIEIPLGSYCSFLGLTFYLKDSTDITILGERNFDYTVIFCRGIGSLRKYKARNREDGRLSFSMTATPREFIVFIVGNMNDRPVEQNAWVVGDCIISEQKTIEFDYAYVSDALQAIADAFKTEWEIDGYTIHLRKVEYNKSTPLALSFGKGNGFKTGVKRTNISEYKPVEILYIQGTNRNIDYSVYGNKTLLLPKSKSIKYDGVFFDGETGYDISRSRTYLTDAGGLYIYRDQTEKPFETYNEDSFDATEIYPARVGVLSSVECVDEEKYFWNITDESIPEALDYSLCRIAGETARIIFQSGRLSGREFEIEATSSKLSGYDHETRTFKLVPHEEDGQMMPGGAWYPEADDKYAVFGIQLPTAYICDDVSKTGASWDMFREVVRHFYSCEDFQYGFDGTLDGIWAKSHWTDALNVGGKCKIGSYVSFAYKDEDPVLIRIRGIKHFVNKPYKPVLELNNTTGGKLTSELRKIGEKDVAIEDSYSRSNENTRRSFRDAMQTQKLLQDSLLNFSKGITPITVRTMQAIVGDDSLQFIFTDSTFVTEIGEDISFDKETKKINITASYIRHETLGLEYVTNEYPVEKKMRWILDSYQSAALDVPAKIYYLYVKVSNTVTDGTDHGSIVLSETAIGMEEEAGFYHLLFALINSESDGDRSISVMSGYSEWSPGRFIIRKIQDKDANLVIDLVNRIIEAKNGAEIKGKLTIGSGSSGLDKFSEYEALVDSIELARLFIQYSVDGSTLWHDTFTSGDLYMRQKNGIAGEWSGAIRLVGIPGDPGQNGSYYTLEYAIGGLEVPTTGWQATAPTPTTGSPYVWLRTRLVTPPSTYGEWTYTKLSGLNGATGLDGKSIEFIFTRTTTATPPSTPTGENTDDFVPVGWSDDQQGVTSTNKYEWSSKRTKVAGTWGTYSAPAMWARYSSDGLPGSDADAQAAKDDIARALGYVSWDAMHNAIENGKTIIEGGHLRTELIEAYSILTSNLSTATSGQRITISKELNAIIMYDASGNIRARLGGDALGSVGTSGSTFACSSNGGSIQKYTSGWTSGVYSYGGSNLLATIQPAESNNSVHIPAIYFDIDITDIAGFSSEDEASITCKFYMGSSLIKSVNYNSNVDGWIHQIVIPALDTELAAISNELRVEFEYSFYVAPGYEGFSALLALTFAASTGSINYPYELTEFAGNGFRSMWASDMYFLVQYLSGANKIEQRVGNYGFRVSASGFEKTTNGGATWVAASL